MEVEFITDKPGVMRAQRRPMSGRLPEWVVLEATTMGGKPEDGLWHYKRMRRVASGMGGADKYYYQFDHAQQV